MLRSAINADYTDKFNLVANVLDTVKMYINPQFYSAEQEGKGADPYARVNRDFAYHSYVGHAKGKIKVSDSMQKTIDKFYAFKRNPSREGVIYLEGKDGIPVAPPVQDDENVLG